MERMRPSPRPAERYADLGGIERVLGDVRELVEYPFAHPEIYTSLGVRFPCGILLHGPPGCGKTVLACAIAGELGVHFFRVSGPELISGMSGESEGKLRALFDEATRAAPAVIFVDEIDAIAPKREASQRGMERRVVAQLQVCVCVCVCVFVCVFVCLCVRACVPAAVAIGWLVWCPAVVGHAQYPLTPPACLPDSLLSICGWLTGWMVGWLPACCLAYVPASVCGGITPHACAPLADVPGHARRSIERGGQASARDRRDEPA